MTDFEWFIDKCVSEYRNFDSEPLKAPEIATCIERYPEIVSEGLCDRSEMIARALDTSLPVVALGNLVRELLRIQAMATIGPDLRVARSLREELDQLEGAPLAPACLEAP